MAVRVGRMQSAAVRAVRVLLHVRGGAGGEIVIVVGTRWAWLAVTVRRRSAWIVQQQPSGACRIERQRRRRRYGAMKGDG